MRNYLSFGGGVNSVAMQLLLIKQGVEFESVFVDHETDWPETYEYFDMFQKWLTDKGYRKITVLKASYGGIQGLYNYCKSKRMLPSMFPRWCTSRFKINIIMDYYQKPCFQFLGIDFGEAHRAKITTEKGVENRYPLIEAEIDRQGCKNIINNSGLPVPIKSGCFICPYQKATDWKRLRMLHPNLFCDAEKLEALNTEYRLSKGKGSGHLHPSGKSLKYIIDEHQTQLFEQDEYPPCNCWL